MFKERKAGILLHPTSLPSDFGIGDLGKNAYYFIDFLYHAKQTFWQMLPLNATTYSPYQAFSAFGRNFLILSPEKLFELHLLSESDLEEYKVIENKKVNYDEIVMHKSKILIKAFSKFKKQENSILMHGFKKFCDDNNDWLDDYSFFMSVKQHLVEERDNSNNSNELEDFIERTQKYLDRKTAEEYYYNAVWNTWDTSLINRVPEAMLYYKNLLFDEIEFHKFCEFMFEIQWTEFKNYAHERGIKIIGDLPIFVSFDSVDVWANKDLFYLDENCFPTVVAGVPPDYFTEDGQLWGNPLYNWPRHKETNYEWWMKRIKFTLKTVDALRMDHFRAFEAYWETKYGEKTAKSGRWVKGPDREFFSAVEHELGKLPLIAEDLGIITPDVEFLRDFFDLPGIAILQFAFDGKKDNPYLPENIGKNTVIYTGTHDNNTTIGWYNSLTEQEKEVVQKLLPFDEADMPYSFIEKVYATNANTAIIPLQDVLCLDEKSRMNVPGIGEGNWTWRYTPDMLKREYQKRLAFLTYKYKRK